MRLRLDSRPFLYILTVLLCYKFPKKQIATKGKKLPLHYTSKCVSITTGIGAQVCAPTTHM